MHIILAIAGIAAAFGYYWFAFRRTRDAVDDVVDMAGRARGAYKRRQFKNKVEASSLTAIGDPRTAAVVMAIAVASRDGHLGAEEEATLRDKMNSVLGVDNEDEEITFAKWVVQENQDPNNISLRLGKLWDRQPFDAGAARPRRSCQRCGAGRWSPEPPPGRGDRPAAIAIAYCLTTFTGLLRSFTKSPSLVPTCV